MSEKINESLIMKSMEWAYKKSLDGIGLFPSAFDLSNEYLKNNNNDKQAAANSMIKWQMTKCATSGFVTGLGGIFILPVAIPANISSVIYIQMRMLAAIASIGGYDIKSDRVKSLVYTCIAGSAAVDILKDVGIKLGTKISEKVLEKISGEVIKAINKAVGIRLLTKFGQTGVINLGKAIPILGGIIGGAIDAASTKTIANISKKTFLA